MKLNVCQSAAKHLNKDEGSETIEKQYFNNIELSRVGCYNTSEAQGKIYLK